MKRRDLSGYLQTSVNASFQLVDCFVGVGDNDHIFRRHVLLFDQIPYFGRHRGGLARSGASHDKTVVVVGDDRSALFWVELDAGVDIVHYVVKVVFQLRDCSCDVGTVVLVYVSRQVLHSRDELFQLVIVDLQCCRVRANVLEHQFVS